MTFNSVFEIKENNLHFKVKNQLLHDIFVEKKQELLDNLRKSLNNTLVQATVEIDATVSKAKPRTEQEKFEIMAEKNPNLLKLKEDLGLDLIF